MLRQIRLILGVNIFWLALSMLFDGINTLVLPLQINQLVARNSQATMLGLLTFIGLLAGALIQPIAGALSDHWRPFMGRKGFIGVGLLLSLVALFFFAMTSNLIGIAISYLIVQISASCAQAGQQGLIPDLLEEEQRGLASGLKGFMDITGAMLGFLILGQLLGAGSSFLAIGAIAVTLITAYLLAIWLTPEDHPEFRPAVRPSAFSFRGAFRLDLTRQADFVRLLIARFLFLLGIYATGRFLLLFVADRLNLPADQAAEQAGTLLAALALITILASPIAGWLADRIGRSPLILAGAMLGAASAFLLIWATNQSQILLFGGLMSLGSAAFAGGSWALLADLVPKNESARFFGLANFSTAGSAAVAGLFGPMMDGVERLFPGQGFSVLFGLACIACMASIFPVRYMFLKEVREVRERNRNQSRDRADAAGLGVLSFPSDPTTVEEDQNPQRKAT